MIWSMRGHTNVARVSDKMKELSGNDWSIDEVALYANDGKAVLGAIQELVTRGWQHFNCAEDIVMVFPHRVRYRVVYHFFRREAVLWRIELMHITDGHSPLHAHLNGDGLELPVVHFSFRVPDRKALLAAEDNLSQEFLHAQSCVSSYGRFSYWGPGVVEGARAMAEAPVYLKPRVNLRDVQDTEDGQ